MPQTEDQIFVSFLNQYQPFLKSFGHNIARTSAVLGVDDVIQELSMAALKAMRSDAFQQAEDPMRYLWCCTRNAGITMIRREDRQPDTISEQHFDPEADLSFLMSGPDPESRIEARDLLTRAKEVAQTFPDTASGRVWRWVIETLTDPTEALIEFAQDREFQQEQTGNKRSYRGAVGFDVCSKEDLEAYVGCGWRSIREAINKVRKALELDD